MKGSPKSYICRCSSCTVGHVVLVTNDQSMVWATALKPLSLIHSSVAVSSDIRYHTPAVLQVLVK